MNEIVKTIGIMGEGQLGMMLAMALQEMGFKVVVLGPNQNGSAMQVADIKVLGSYDDMLVLKRLAECSDVVTCEFENVSVSSLNFLAGMGVDVWPHQSVLSVAQDRQKEKEKINSINLPTAEWHLLDKNIDLDMEKIKSISWPAIIKTCNGGYDGKNQMEIESFEQVFPVWEREFYNNKCILEEKIDFDFEISVIVARKPDGTVGCFPPVFTYHEDGILIGTIWPCEKISAGIEEKAIEYAKTMAEDLDVVGLLAVEMFVVDGDIYINEIAPRPHNSGHWTMDAGCASQFEQLARILVGWPLGSFKPTKAVQMRNVLEKKELKYWRVCKNIPSNIIFIDYKKEERGDGNEKRKRGYVNFVSSL